ncbi:hypothetical protein E2C01_071670 [Portunus trituberculatus]|uniref:Uncharacterized protein n=1 Tax=Portunus trituberculatus TaxID=210409 RepID=A0A5B7I0H8_PORTR|nr:hypothetical protein [Portunus trituberculatus]
MKSQCGPISPPKRIFGLRQSHLHLEPWRHVGNFKPLDKWQSFKTASGGIRTYIWSSTRSHAHHLIHYTTASLRKSHIDEEF